MDGGQMYSAIVTIAVVSMGIQATHFRGGTINWRSLGGRKVQFFWKLGWANSLGPGCTETLIGKRVSRISGKTWKCMSGCSTKTGLGEVMAYICTGANDIENWEQGQDSFTYTFPNDGPFNVGYTGSNWIGLSNGMGNGKWNVGVTVYLGQRSDTGEINTSPKSLNKPMYYVYDNCEIKLHIPAVDDDGDTVRCRWAVGNECVSVCMALPGAVLDQEKCTIRFNSTSAMSYISEGMYAVAIMIEDFPKHPMTIGTMKKTPSDAISSVPVQFLVKTIPHAESCDQKPRFVSPSPANDEVLTVEEGDLFSAGLFADNGKDTSILIKRITASGILDMKASPITPDGTRNNTFTTTLTWQTGLSDLGKHLVCSDAENAKKNGGDERCFSIDVVSKGCGKYPCKNHGKCQSDAGGHNCTCRPGFTGHDCEISLTPLPATTPTTSIVTPSSVNATGTPANSSITTAAPPIVTVATPQCLALDYGCQCTLYPTHNERSQTRRDLLAVLYGLPFGLVLSLITYLVYWHCSVRQRTPERRDPQQREQRDDTFKSSAAESSNQLTRLSFV